MVLCPVVPVWLVPVECLLSADVVSKKLSVEVLEMLTVGAVVLVHHILHLVDNSSHDCG